MNNNSKELQGAGNNMERRAVDNSTYYYFLVTFIFVLLGSSLCAQIVHQDFNHLNALQEFRGSPPAEGQVNRINLNPLTSDGSAVFTLAEEGENKFIRVHKQGRNMRHFDRTSDIENAPTLMISFDFELISSAQDGRIATWYIGDYLNPNSFFPEVHEKWAEIGIFANSNENSFQLSSERPSLSVRSIQSYTGKRKIKIVVNNSGETVLYDSPDGFVQLLPDKGLHLWVDEEQQAIPIRPFLGENAHQINAVKFLLWNTPFDAVFHIDNLIIAPLPIVPLPVELLSFRAAQLDSDIVLAWQTSSEKNNSYFEIERSLDGESFASLGRVPSAGNSNSLKTYSFTDHAAAEKLAGSVYYRLKMVDVDGTFEYSPVELVSLPDQSFKIISVSPNPFGENILINVQNRKEQLVELKLLDQQGNVLLQQTEHLRPGVPELSIRELDKLSPGIYFLKINASENQGHYRLLKL